MTLMHDIQQGDYYELSVLGGMYTLVTADSLSAFAAMNGILESMGFDDRTMRMGENPLYEKTGDGKHILATITLYKPDGQPYSTEEFRHKGAQVAAAPDRQPGEGE